MKTPSSVVARLVTSIEGFVEQEAIALRSGDCSGVAAAAKRVAPVVARLGALCASDPAARMAIGGRIAALLEKRRQNQDALAARRVFLQSEFRRIAEAHRRLRVVAPAYGRCHVPAPSSARLKAAV